VKNGVHTLAYHHVWKKFHFAPGIAFWLVQNKWVNEHLDRWVDRLVDKVENIVERIERAFQSKR
jgi:hypothetical protein